MSESVFSGLLHTLDKSTLSQIAENLGESEHGISRGMESSIASVLGVMAQNADDSGALQAIFDLMTQDSGELTWSQLAKGLNSPTSPWLTAGKRICWGLFGSINDTVTHLVGHESDVGPETAAMLLAMAAPMTLWFVRKRVQDESLNMSGASSLLHNESAAIRSALPAGLRDLLWRSRPAPSSVALAGKPFRQQKTSAAWVGALGLAAVALGSFWLWSHIHSVGSELGVATIGKANRFAGAGPNPGDTTKHRLAGSLEGPANETQAGLLGTLGALDPYGQPSWVSCDRLKFGPGSVKLPAGASEQLNQIAEILKTHPDLHLTIAGFTDNLESNGKNLELSRSRAETVKSALVERAISPDRITTQGFGEQSPLADNATADGRAINRRVSMRVTQP